MKSLKQQIAETVSLIVKNDNVVLFTGAGISTASGLPDFRGPDGVWTRRDKGLPPPAPAVPHDKIKPNATHKAIVDLEKAGKVSFLISQNVDGLHLDSGYPIEKLAELHGNKNLVMCIECERKCTKEEAGWDDRIHGKGYRTDYPLPGQPRCIACNGRMISSIVNFEDPLPTKDFREAMNHSRKCDLFIVLGSSLVVNPAARMVAVAKRNGATLIINNLGDTPYDAMADMLVTRDINEYFPAVVRNFLDHQAQVQEP